jgi:hypothetical protein
MATALSTLAVQFQREPQSSPPIVNMTVRFSLANCGRALANDAGTVITAGSIKLRKSRSVEEVRNAGGLPPPGPS